ncbi:MAG: type 2 isopentenyl-diphosphate Delta-isomerase [Anaerolineaceae bacterium]|nr:type 2 isopentenyl-diphosphate Delta-isomerase [Anaerolineaceae bacterium]
MNDLLSNRKSDHIHINLNKDVASGASTGFDQYRFIHDALPEVDFQSVSLKTRFFGRHLNAPLLISSMTGGTEDAARINQHLALAAQNQHIAMGVGSQRAMIEHPETTHTFQVRKYAPDILLFANLGAVQLNYGYGLEQCERVVETIEADGMILHLNPLQEVVQPEGDQNFANLLPKIESICRALPVPVIVKEVGSGISVQTARRLFDAGVSAIDLAGAGGTSWAKVESHRQENETRRRMAAQFADWGIPTANALVRLRLAAPDRPIIASGGIRDGITAAKALALGADLVGLTSPFLKAAVTSAEAVIAAVKEITETLRVCAFLTGCDDLKSFQSQTVIEKIE